VDVFNPESAKRENEDIYINPASQDIYADFYNGMLGTDLGWEQIFEQTDRDINLQRVMNVTRFGNDTVRYDWIPERAIGPTEDCLYEAEADYNDAQVSEIMKRSAEDVASMDVTVRRSILMEHRKNELRRLIQVYYEERGWSERGIPKVETLQRLGLWDFLTEETKATLQALV
jgi:aldehyde:ferredoxin oxidoreductase